MTEAPREITCLVEAGWIVPVEPLPFKDSPLSLRAKAVAATMVVRRRNILKMLGRTAGLAIKKTLGF